MFATEGHRNIDWIGVAQMAALGLLMVVVLVVALVAATPQQYRPSAINRILSDYPVRLDLADIEQATRQRDLAEQEAARLAAEAAAEERAIAEQLALELSLASESSESEDSAGPVPAEDAVGASRESNRASANDLSQVEFDLAGGAEAPGTLQLAKDVQVNDSIVGRVQVRVDSTSAVYLSRADILRVLPIPESAAVQLDQEFVLLSDLRALGVNLRYDPTLDQLVYRQ